MGKKTVDGVKVEYSRPLYALGRRGGPKVREWYLFDYFTTERKAANAKARCERNWKNSFPEDSHTQFAVLAFRPESGVWKKV